MNLDEAISILEAQINRVEQLQQLGMLRSAIMIQGLVQEYAALAADAIDSCK